MFVGVIKKQLYTRRNLYIALCLLRQMRRHYLRSNAETIEIYRITNNDDAPQENYSRAPLLYL